MLATDFFHIDCAVTLQRLYCEFVIEVGGRHVDAPGVTAIPDGLWTTPPSGGRIATARCTRHVRPPGRRPLPGEDQPQTCPRRPNQ
jgi:hypothetical protein